MQNILILGAGGHAQVVADILLRACEADHVAVPIGYLDDDSKVRRETLLGLPVLGRIADIRDIAHDAVVVAIGENRTRKQLFDSMRQLGECIAVVRHPGAVIAPDVKLGAGTVICPGVIVNTGSVIGENVILNTGCTVDHHNHIADHVHVAPGAHLGGEVFIDEGALVGIGAAVMPGLRVGAWSIVGAGSLIHREVPHDTTVFGVPARVIRQRTTR
jgi:sugar O-acyltransferase (sialic acid O-acetyltransferase NeuD family)